MSGHHGFTVARDHLPLLGVYYLSANFTNTGSVATMGFTVKPPQPAGHGYNFFFTKDYLDTTPKLRIEAGIFATDFSKGKARRVTDVDEHNINDVKISIPMSIPEPYSEDVANFLQHLETLDAEALKAVHEAAREHLKPALAKAIEQHEHSAIYTPSTSWPAKFIAKVPVLNSKMETKFFDDAERPIENPIQDIPPHAMAKCLYVFTGYFYNESDNKFFPQIKAKQLKVYPPEPHAQETSGVCSIKD